jgi:hypothetical protein
VLPTNELWVVILGLVICLLEEEEEQQKTMYLIIKEYNIL